uniref:Uncharacterized protein n=1 Tax=Arundo donax TaxID=35708 RepID=A0A0A9A0U6_ARUDO
MKFKAATRCLQSWSHKRIGHLKSQLGLAKEIIHQLEIAWDVHQLTTHEIWLVNI